jgi:hypothetical protein
MRRVNAVVDRVLRPRPSKLFFERPANLFELVDEYRLPEIRSPR